MGLGVSSSGRGEQGLLTQCGDQVLDTMVYDAEAHRAACVFVPGGKQPLIAVIPPSPTQPKLLRRQREQ